MPPFSEGKQFYSPAPVLATAPFPRLQKERGKHINDGKTHTDGEKRGRRSCEERGKEKNASNKKLMQKEGLSGDDDTWRTEEGQMAWWGSKRVSGNETGV